LYGTTDGRFKIKPQGENMSNQVYWTTRNGDRIRVVDMDDDHLINAYSMLVKRGFVGSDEVCEDLEGDGYYYRPQSNFLTIFRNEIHRRGIKLQRSIDPVAKDLLTLLQDIVDSENFPCIHGGCVLSQYFRLKILRTIADVKRSYQ
jgi:hypothetical protein